MLAHKLQACVQVIIAQMTLVIYTTFTEHQASLVMIYKGISALPWANLSLDFPKNLIFHTSDVTSTASLILNTLVMWWLMCTQISN